MLQRCGKQCGDNRGIHPSLMHELWTESRLKERKERDPHRYRNISKESFAYTVE